MRVGLLKIILLLLLYIHSTPASASDFFESWLPIRSEAYNTFSTNSDSAFALMERFLEDAISTDNRRAQFEGFLIIADLYTSNLNSERAIENIRLAERHHDKNNLEEQAKLKMTYAWYYDYFKALPEAVNYYSEVFLLAKKLDDRKLISSVGLNLGGILVESGQTDLAIKYLKESLSTRLEHTVDSRDSVRVGTAYSSLGYAYFYTNEFEKALKCYDNSAFFVKNYNDARYFRAVLSALDCATSQGDIIAAENRFKLIENNNEQLKVNRNFVGYYLNYGRLLASKNLIDSAIACYNKAINFINENALDVSQKRDVYKNLHKAYLKKEDYSKAYSILNIYNNLIDSLNTAQNEQSLQRSFALFDLNKKNSRIEDLSQAIEDSEYVINSNKVLIRIGLGMLAIFAIIGLYYYLKKREKEKYTSILEEKIDIATKALSKANNDLMASNKLLTLKNDEKTVLLREIHHRVKNNMQMVVSIIRIERSLDESIGPEELLHKLENRIHSISEIHEKLYKPSGSDYKFINAKDFFDDVAFQIFKVFAPPGEGKFSLKCHIESFSLPFDKVIQLGIILNELFANTFKYGFKNKSTGEVEIHLTQSEKNKALFTYRDNGTGFPESSLQRDIEEGFGKQIVDLLISQLSGEQKRYNEDGAVIEVDFIMND